MGRDGLKDVTVTTDPDLFSDAVPTLDAADLERVDDYTVRLPTGELLRLCAWPECDESFIVPKGQHARKYCDTHKGSKHAPGTKGAPRRDTPPASVNVNFPKPTTNKDPALAAVERRLLGMAGVVSMALLLFGQPLDAADIERARPTWAAAGAELAKYEPWLKKLAAGGESSDRMMAWLAFLGATFGMVTPVLLRHNALPAPVANLLRSMEETPEADAMGKVFAAMHDAAGAPATDGTVAHQPAA